MTELDLSELNKALRIGGAGLRAEPHAKDAAFKVLYLPNGGLLDECLDGACTDYLRNVIEDPNESQYPLTEYLRTTPAYQSWLARAECEHDWTFQRREQESFCRHCGVALTAVDHYTLLRDEPEQPVCAVCGCEDTCPAVDPTLCHTHMEAFLKSARGTGPLAWCNEQYAQAARTWAAKQKTPAPGPVGVHPGSCSAADGVPPSRGDNRGANIEGGDATSEVHPRERTPIAGPGDEPGSAVECGTGKCEDCGADNVLLFACDRQGRENDGLESFDTLCVYCHNRRSRIRDMREDLDRPLDKRIDDAREQLGYDHSRATAWASPAWEEDS